MITMTHDTATVDPKQCDRMVASTVQAMLRAWVSPWPSWRKQPGSRSQG